MRVETSITVQVQLAIRRWPERKTVVTPAQEGIPAVATRADPALVTALARASWYQRLFDQGRYASVSQALRRHQPWSEYGDQRLSGPDRSAAPP